MMPTTERTWDRRVEKWHSHVTSTEAFGTVLDRLIQLSSPKPADACVDLGAGTGFVATALRCEEPCEADRRAQLPAFGLLTSCDRDCSFKADLSFSDF